MPGHIGGTSTMPCVHTLGRQQKSAVFVHFLGVRLHAPLLQLYGICQYNLRTYQRGPTGGRLHRRLLFSRSPSAMLDVILIARKIQSLFPVPRRTSNERRRTSIERAPTRIPFFHFPQRWWWLLFCCCRCCYCCIDIQPGPGPRSEPSSL